MSSPIQQKPPRYSFPKPYADFVARVRVPSGFLLLVVFAWLSHPSRLSMLIGLPVSLLGLWLRAWASGHLAKDQQLAISGPYAYIRNPLYTGSLIVAVGILIAARDALLGIIFILAFSLIYLPVIELEEQHLRKIFPLYLAYAAEVNRFFPGSKWTGPQRRFSWSLYLRNEEYKALLGFLLATAWLVWKCWRSGRLG
ncbi:MAG: methyltransferase family protein [Bryobacteraceae bacterium]